MSDTTRFEQVEETLDFDVSDEALESAAREQAGIYTLGSCTGYYSCPGN
jgi:hypothetical protein